MVAENPEQVQSEEVLDDSKENKAQQKLFSLEILKVIKDAQQQHGLRHSDFQRYRCYCTRRIRRLRKTLKLPQGEKRHFKRRDVTETNLKDDKYLLIPLMQAERAWAYAMQLRQEANTEPRKKFHLIARLKKSVTHAQQLFELSQLPVCDARTKLEAQAYKSWILGTFQFELHLWKDAMDNLQKAQMVYEKLTGAVGEEDMAVYKHKCEELVPSLRYCAYNIGDTSAIEDLKNLRSLADPDMLDKLDALIANTAVQEAAQGGLIDLKWRKHNIPIKSSKVAAFIRCEEELGPLDGEGAETDLRQLERHVIRCKDTIACVKDDLAAEMGKGGKVTSLKILLGYLTYTKLARSNQRTLLMIQQAKDSYSSSTEDGKKSKPQDLIRLYELVIQNLQDMEGLTGVDNDTQFQDNLLATILAFKAFRCYYIGEVLSSSKRFREAHALYDRAEGYANQALSSNQLEANVEKQLRPIIRQVESAKCSCLAQAVLQGEASGETKLEELPGLRSEDRTPLVSRLDLFKEDPSLATKNAYVVDLPPPLEPIPCKPIYYDISLNFLEWPSFEEQRPQANQPGGLSGFVKGLWGWGGKGGKDSQSK